jgi:hypothetical protein
MKISAFRFACIAAVAAVLVVGTFVAPARRAQAAGIYGSNLVLNGNAEAGPGAPSSDKIVDPIDWSTTGQFTAVQYGASGGFPDATSPGPSDRGKNLFEGGNVAKSVAQQTVSFAPAQADINAGGVHYAFSAWIGGYASQEDSATVAVAFRDAKGATLGSATLGPVTPSDRKGTTGLLARSQAGVVPKGAVEGLVTITITRVNGTYNDGSVDDVSLILTKP